MPIGRGLDYAWHLHTSQGMAESCASVLSLIETNNGEEIIDKSPFRRQSKGLTRPDSLPWMTRHLSFGSNCLLVCMEEQQLSRESLEFVHLGKQSVLRREMGKQNLKV